MNAPRRIAAALLSAALSLGVVGVVASPADAMKDTTWPTRTDTTWPTKTDTTWPTMKDTTWPTMKDTTWPTM